MESKEGMEREADPLTGEHFPSGGLRIKIVGVGGAGTNAVDRIKLEDLEQVQLAAADTDQQVLQASPVEETLLLGGLSATARAPAGWSRPDVKPPRRRKRPSGGVFAGRNSYFCFAAWAEGPAAARGR